jgi:non-ribosomal peptide synthetase component F
MSNLNDTGGVPGPGRIGRVAIGDLLKRAAQRFPDRTAVTDGERRVTFTELECDANRFANYLVGRGLKPGYGGRDARRLAMYALRAIIAASTPSADDHRAQLDYLSELPEAAWESWYDVSVLSSREETLAWIARNISLS